MTANPDNEEAATGSQAVGRNAGADHGTRSQGGNVRTIKKPVRVYKVRVSTDLEDNRPETLIYFVPAKTVAEAVGIIEDNRPKSFEGEPLRVVCIEEIEGLWLWEKR